MRRSMRWWAILPVLMALTAPVAQADDLKVLREEIAQMKKSYEERIAALEARLAQAEAKVEAKVEAKAEAPAEPPKVSRGDTPAAGGFNPEISLILNGRATRMKDVAERSITGFWPARGHDHGGDKRGLSVDGSELVVSANVDPNFRGHLNVALADGAAMVEEAWFQTLGLGNGLKIKGGRFLSGVGYLNEQHPHAWDFADAPLMTKVLFGEHYAHDGVQFKWLAPTDLFVELGAELGRGANFPGTDRNKSGNGAGSLFGHVGGDWGRSSAWRAGLSWLATRADRRGEHARDTAGAGEVDAMFSGRSRTWIADFVWKWVPDGNSRSRNFKLQTEFFRRTEAGTLGCAAGAGVLPGSPCAGDPSGDYRSRQSGFYAQGVWQFIPEWRVGYRYDHLNSGAIAAGLLDAGVLERSGALVGFRPTRHALMADWSPSEFSRLRLQFARDKSMVGITDDQWTLQYVMSLGSHGAHRF